LDRWRKQLSPGDVVAYLGDRNVIEFPDSCVSRRRKSRPLRNVNLNAGGTSIPTRFTATTLVKSGIRAVKRKTWLTLHRVRPSFLKFDRLVVLGGQDLTCFCFKNAF